MGKRVIQIAVDIVVDEGRGYDADLEEEIAEVLENGGISVMGMCFSEDQTEYYREHLGSE